MAQVLHRMILVAQSAAHNIWLYTLDAEVTKLFEAACCQSVCLRPIWQLHPRVSCPHQLNIGVNLEHVTRDTARTHANDGWREARGRVAQQERNPFFKAELKIISLISCCAGKWCEALWGNHTMLFYQGSSRPSKPLLQSLLLAKLGHSRPQHCTALSAALHVEHQTEQT